MIIELPHRTHNISLAYFIDEEKTSIVFIDTDGETWGYDNTQDTAWPFIQDAIANGLTVAPNRPSDFHEWDGVGWVVNTERAWESVRSIRDGLLAACDWTMVADAPTDKTAWTAYRQALRDLPETQTDPFNIVWPVPPNQ